MMDLFPVEAKPEAFYSNKLRVVRVLGDGMAPTLRGGVDWALIRPIDHYVGEGVYLVGRPTGSDFYRAASTLDGKRTIRL